MEKIKFGKLFNSLPKSNLTTNDGAEFGEYPFFTSSKEVRKKTDNPIYFDEALIIGDGGAANINYSKTPFSTNSHCYIYSSYKNINVKYVYYYLKSNIHLLSKGFKGAGIKNISKKYIENNIYIDVPTLEVQNKIVTILDKVESIITKREQNIAFYKDFVNSSFLDRFDSQIRDSKCHVDFSAAVSEIRTGWSPICKDHGRSDEDEIAVLKQSSVSKRFFDSSENKLLPENTIIKKECFVKKDDLLFSRKNTLEYVGSSAYIFEDVKNLLIPDTIFNLRYRKDIVSGVYLHFLFNDTNYRKNIRELATGALISMSNISKQKLLELKLPIPDLALQLEFENLVRFINSKIKNQTQSLNSLEILLKSLTQKLFNGQSFIDLESEVEAIINSINLDAPDAKNNIERIKKDMTFRQKLIDKLASQNFSNIEQYNKARYIAFRLLKENENKITQEFDLNKNKIVLG